MTTISSIDARFAQVQVGEASKKVTASVQNLVSGTKTNANVADLSVGTVLASRVNTLRVAVGNAGQAKSLLETAKGGLTTILGLLQQQKSLATKASDDSLGNNERGFLDLEFQALVSEIDRIASTANFNGKTLLDGSISGNAGVTTATGLTTENYSLIRANQFKLAGTVLSGDLLTTASKKGETTLTFGAIGGTAGTETLQIDDTLGVFGQAAAGTEATSTITYVTTANATAAATAAAFVAAAKATTTFVARQFDYIDNFDGTVRISARNYGDELQGMTFTGSDIDGTLTIGNAATPGSLDGAALVLSTTYQDDNSLGVDGTFRVIQSANVATTATTNIITLGGATGAANDIVWTLGGQTIATYTAAAVTETNTAIAAALVASANASTNDYARRFTYSSSGAVITITNTILGADTANDALQFDMTATVPGTLTATLGGVDLVAGAAGTDTAFVPVTSTAGLTLGAYRAANVSDTEQTFDSTLQGAITGLSANYQAGVSGGNNTVQFSAVVGGKTYQSQVVSLYGSTAGTGVDSNTILANTVLTFTNADGARETGGNEYTDQAWQLQLGTTAVTTITNQSTANTFADAMQTQLANTVIVQDRGINLGEISASTSDHRITKAIGTVLEGIRGVDSVGTDKTAYIDGDIRLTSGVFGTTGTQGSIGSFTVSRLTDTITTTIDGVLYTAYLNSSTAPTTGGVQSFGTDDDGSDNNGSYNSTTKIIDLQSGTDYGKSAKFIFYSASTTDGNMLTIDLGNVVKNVAQINIATAEGEAALKAALDATLNVSANDSLSFQVGNAASDTIGVSISGTKTTDVYLDSSGVATVLSVDTIANSIIASGVLDNAINNVVTRISNVSAKISSFNSAIQNNQTSIQNADAARGNLLDTDYTQESTMFAEGRVRVDAATAVLAQINTRAVNLLQLLRQ